MPGVSYTERNRQPQPQKIKKQLNLLREKIRSVSKQLQWHRLQQNTVLYQLNNAETQLASLALKLDNNTRRQARQQHKLLKLQQTKSITRISLEKLISEFGEDARLAFLQGRQSWLKILLANQSYAATRRGLVYHRYIQQHRQQRIATIHRKLDYLRRVEQSIRASKAVLHKLRASYERQRLLIVSRQNERRSLLRQIAAQLKTDQQRLQAHRKSREELTRVLSVIRKTLGKLPVTKIVFKRFPALKGRLDWPVKGRIISRFGQKKAGHSLHSRGVFIRTPGGSKVAAISWGRVVYADWLRGFGLIIVIDHGDKYLSLYGHNHTLYKQVGDWVKSGEIIAATGDSGGMGHSGLYFEIRKRGIPLNPVKWCRKSDN